MRGDILALLLYEAKVKPEIKHLVDNIMTMTQHDIDNAQVPLPWFKQALTILKNKRLAEQLTSHVLDNMITGETLDPIGWTAKWHDVDSDIMIDRNNTIEIKTNTWIWFPDTGGVWIESLYSSTIDPRLLTLHQTEQLTKSQYMTKYKERLHSLNPTSSINLTNEITPKFTIYRH